MPSFCVVSNCEHKYTHSENISFHKFPNSQEIRQKWIDFTDRGSDWKPSKWSTICSRHFLPSDFRDLNTRKCLKRDAVPSITMKQFNFNLFEFNRNLSNELKKPPEINSISTSSCRLCGQSANEIITFSKDYKIFNMIKKCLPTLQVQKDDELPKNLCSNCLQKLHNFSDFIDNVFKIQKDFEEKFLLSQQNRNYSTSNGVITNNNNVEKQLKIKQEPIVKVKQEILDGLNSNINNFNFQSLNDFDKNNETEETNRNNLEEKLQINNNLNLSLSEYIPNSSSLSPQDIINNCEIMEIISLDDAAFIDIPDDDIVDDKNTKNSNEDSPTKVKVIKQKEFPNNFEGWDHNYTRNPFDIHIINVSNYKTEKLDENDFSIKQQQQQQHKQETDIIVINESIIESLIPITAMPSVSNSTFKRSLYHCNQCEMEFISQKFLEEHMKFGHNHVTVTVPVSNINSSSLNAQYKCLSCNSTFHTLYALLQHKNKDHRNVKCSEKFIKNKRKIYSSCPHCDKIFINKLALNNHLKFICEYSQKQVYGCRYCNENVEGWILLKKHEKNCKLKVNVKKETSIGLISKHLKYVSPNPNGRYSCEICGRNYSRRSNLYKHQRKHRPINQWNLKCGDCERLFDRIYDLRQHLNKNECTGNNEGRQLEQILYVCIICRKEFKTIQRLETHMMIHSGEKPYVCETCGKSFPCFNNLYQHRITHTDLRRYKCDLCDKIFKRKGGLNQHKKSLHMKLKPFECPVCYHRYALKNDMMKCRHSNLRC